MQKQLPCQPGCLLGLPAFQTCLPFRPACLLDLPAFQACLPSRPACLFGLPALQAYLHFRPACLLDLPAFQACILDLPALQAGLLCRPACLVGTSSKQIFAAATNSTNKTKQCKQYVSSSSLSFNMMSMGFHHGIISLNKLNIYIFTKYYKLRLVFTKLLKIFSIESSQNKKILIH